VPAVSADALDVLERYAWPGNVRELRGVADAIVAARLPAVTLAALPPTVVDAVPAPARDDEAMQLDELIVRLVKERHATRAEESSSHARRAG
jgi:DNA-binding NtrC family response regulator